MSAPCMLQVADLVTMIIPLRDVNTVEKVDGGPAGSVQANAMVVTTRGKVHLVGGGGWVYFYAISHLKI